MSTATTRTSLPEATKAVVEGEVRLVLGYVAGRKARYGPHIATERVLLLRAAPEWRGPAELTVVTDAGPVTVLVRGCGTVLAVLAALAEPRPPEAYLVVLTPCADEDLGVSLLTQALGHGVQEVNRWDLVAAAFKARRLDPRLTDKGFEWLAEALLDAQPGAGWRPAGPVLQLDAALGRLAAVRFGAGPGVDEGLRLDAAALLEWTRDETRVAHFSALRQEEQDGLISWLEESAGPVARIVFRLLRGGQVADAVPFGLAAAELYASVHGAEDPSADVAGRGAEGRSVSMAGRGAEGRSVSMAGRGAESASTGVVGRGAKGASAGLAGRPPSEDTAAGRRQVVLQARIRAEERFLGGHPMSEAGLRAFAEAAESLTLRWSDNGRALQAQALCDRAEQILAELRAGDLAGASKVLGAGLDARLAGLADEISAVLPDPRPADLPPVEEALDRLRQHRRLTGRTGEVASAEAAVRLVRWLAGGEPLPVTVAEGVTAQARSWAWVDWALAHLWTPDTARVPRAGTVYATLHDLVRARRAEVDRAFAERLAGWTAVAADTAELLLAENLLDRVARPVAERAAPLIIVLDGMSSAVACQLAQEITAGRTWIEVGRDSDGREGALATIPSATSFSRTSLLCGRLTTGGQAEERAGFAAFWRGRTAVLFHRAGLPAGPGAVLHEDVAAAIRKPGEVVGVVLNTIDDALRDDLRISSPTWRLDEVDYLRQLLNAAASAQRPVILTSDHGHVLDRGDDIRPAKGDGARYRTGGGAPGEGELSFSGPRVLSPGGEVVVPWDERIRYTPRKAGYHGGVSTAEMVIPVLVFLPSPDMVPDGWAAYDNPSLHEPTWWNPPPTTVSPASPPPPPKTSSKARKKLVQDDALFVVPNEEAVNSTGPGLGARVVASPQFAAQRAFVRKAPDDAVVAALIDGLAEAGGKLPTAVAARLAGQPPFRMPGYLAQVGRLLNVDGYPVIGEADGGRTVQLNLTLLKEQFLEAE